ncbi:MAG: hypothetical protein HXS46_02435 [Theionarchaea archaeon]|nr:hypothetical protein [Theionarchaea archaeon]
MNSKGLILIALVIPHMFFIPTQEKTVITQFDQHYTLLPTGNLTAVWEITILPHEGIKNMLLHIFFSQKAYVTDVVVTDAEGSLNSRMISREGLPILEITFRDRLTPNTRYHFTCELEVWKAVELGETEGSFNLLTGYNFPVETLTITAALPEGTAVREFFPSDGTVSTGKEITVTWTMNSLPIGFNIQISLYFDILSVEFADNLFSEGENLYNLQDFENAQEKFEQALTMYQSLNLQEKADQCTLYLDRIEGLQQGLPLFENAVELYNNGDYTQAAAEFKQVKSIYEQHQVPTDEVDQYISDSTQYAAAWEEFQKAEASLQQGDDEEARNHYVRARELFSELDDVAIVQQIDSEIEQIAPQSQGDGTLPVGGIVILIVVVIAVAVAGLTMMKRKKPPPVYSEKEIQEEMRELKARFVYGEINKKEYEEQLAELENQLKTQKSV